MSVTKVATVDGVRVTCLVSEYASYESPLLSQHGLALFVDVLRDKKRQRILFDTGQDAEPILRNMHLMGMDPNSIDMIVISHNHFDHAFGLDGILKAIGRRVPVIGHKTLFRQTFGVGRRPLYRLGLTESIDREKLEHSGAYFILVEEPLPLMPGVYATGTVEQIHAWEKDRWTGTHMIDDGRLVEDTGLDDLSLVVNVAGMGLVVLTGCGHAGVINTIYTAKRITGVEETAGVVGGFHLVMADLERLDRTVEGFRELKVGRVVAGHCTGFEACAHFRSTLGDRFSVLYTGEAYDFSTVDLTREIGVGGWSALKDLNRMTCKMEP